MKVIKPTTTQFKFSESDRKALTDTAIMLTKILDNMHEDEILFGYLYDELQGLTNAINIIDTDILNSLEYNNGVVVCGK